MADKPDDKDHDHDLKDHKFYHADMEAGFADSIDNDTPQTRHPAYRLAFRDEDFLLREELRPVRFQLELLKPEMLLDEARRRLHAGDVRLGPHPPARSDRSAR